MQHAKECSSYLIQKKKIPFKRFKPRNDVFKLVLAFTEIEPNRQACSKSIKESTAEFQLAGEEGMKGGTSSRNWEGVQIRIGRI